jgi:hypothetical protein
MEGIAVEADRIFKKHKLLHTETIQNIDNLIKNLKSSSQSHKITTDLTQKIQDAHKDLQLSIHKYSKTVEKRWKQDLVYSMLNCRILIGLKVLLMEKYI